MVAERSHASMRPESFYHQRPITHHLIQSTEGDTDVVAPSMGARVAVLVLNAAAQAQQKPPAAVENDLPKFTGLWTVTAAELAGEQAPDLVAQRSRSTRRRPSSLRRVKTVSQ